MGASDADVKRLQIDRVVRSTEITDAGRIVISFEAEGVHFRVEMSPDQATDLSGGLARSLQMLEARRPPA
jgi:hypothetical protein